MRLALRLAAFALFYVSLCTAGTLLISALLWDSNVRPSFDFPVTRTFALCAGLLVAVLNVEAWFCFRSVAPRLVHARDQALVVAGIAQGLVPLLVMDGMRTTPTGSEFTLTSTSIAVLSSIIVLDTARRNAGAPIVGESRRSSEATLA